MKKIIEFVLYLVGILYLPSVLAASFLSEVSSSFFIFLPFWFVFGVLFFISFHFYCVLLEIGFSALRILEKRPCTIKEKILNVSTISLAAIILLLLVIDPEREFYLLALILSGVLVILWVVGDLLFKSRKFFPELYKKKSFWLSAVALFAVACIILAFSGGRFKNKPEPDPLEPSIETQQIN